MPPQVDKVRVRMYRQGLGDCFLLTFFTGADETHLLIDCGVFKGTEDAKAKMRGIAENVLATTDAQLAVLVATHEHWDHLSGFLQAGDLFEGLHVGAVWVAWTENPDDDLAKELGARKARALRTAATAARKLRRADPAARSLAEGLDALLGFEGDLGAAGRARTTHEALDWVKSRQKPEPEYRRPGELLTDLPGLPGVRVYVLGPPHDRSKIRRSDPSKVHSEVYELAGDAAAADLGFFAAVDALERAGQAGEQPFDPFFTVAEADAHEERLFAERYDDPGEEWRRIEHDWLGVAGRLALQLDSDTNNTSLALAFELPGGKVLLFPGDAQVGNWLSWEELEWKLEDGATPRTVKAPELLARTVLYKVGHHASHNATLREKGLELMVSNDLVAMIPVGRRMAKKKGWKMPFPPLYQRLYEKTNGRILDGDRGLAGKEGRAAGDAWDRFVARTDVQRGWIDYTIES